MLNFYLDKDGKAVSLYSKAETIRNLLGSFNHDMVSLYQIIAGGREDMRLSNDELIPFVRECIVALIDANGMPAIMKGEEDGKYSMEIVYRYGTSPESIADAILVEWKMFGYPTPVPPGELWFAPSMSSSTLLNT